MLSCRRCVPVPTLERDDFSSNRHLALSYAWSMIFSENRYPLFGIMLKMKKPIGIIRCRLAFGVFAKLPVAPSRCGYSNFATPLRPAGLRPQGSPNGDISLQFRVE